LNNAVSMIGRPASICCQWLAENQNEISDSPKHLPAYVFLVPAPPGLRWFRRMKSADSRLVRLIAVFKLLKAVLLIVVGVGALKLLHKDVASVLEHWVAVLGLDARRVIGSWRTPAKKFQPNRQPKSWKRSIRTSALNSHALRL
jgi:hypothetical protein